MAKKVINDDPVSNAVLTVLDLLRIGAKRVWRNIRPIKASFGSLALGTAHPLWSQNETEPFWITRALRESAVAVELVVYPREPHGIQERNHQRDLHRRVLTRFDRWLKGGI